MTPPASLTRGVVLVPTTAVHLDIQKHVAGMLAAIAPGNTTAMLSLPTHAGFNFAIAHKFAQHWKVVAYIGKSGWDQPLTGGGVVTFSA